MTTPAALPTECRILEPVRPVRPGDAVLRVRRRSFAGLTRVGIGHLAAGGELEEPRTLTGRLWQRLIGAPIPCDKDAQERLSKTKALAVFSSDALSSVAYAPQQVLIVLLAAGAAALPWSLPISLAVMLLLAVVVTGYRQTIHAYPSGGGSYTVARANLGELPGLVAAAALLVGYTLTVSVSVAQAMDELGALLPPLLPYRVGLGVGAIGLLTLANLRGIREAGNLFAVPTYLFVVVMYGMIGAGLILLAGGRLSVPPPAEPALTAAPQPLSWVLLLRAFATGCAVMTGTEAISNGIPAFRAPEPRNAARTLVSMGLILGTLLLGLSLLIAASGLVPSANQTVLSQLGAAIFGRGPLYAVIEGSAVLILVLAANTAYADFPRLMSLLARDHYAPHQLARRGTRLVFSNGILLLGLVSALLLVLFGGSSGALLPLYGLSVFGAFTLSEAGMLHHWWRKQNRHWQLKAAINGLGATATGLVVLIVASTEFANPELPVAAGLPLGWGAWVVLVVVPLLVAALSATRRHYDRVACLTAVPVLPEPARPLAHLVVVPIARVDGTALQALRYAQMLSTRVTAVHVATSGACNESVTRQWAAWAGHVPLVVIDSPYRSLARPLLRYLDELKRLEGADLVTVVFGEGVPRSWSTVLLHGRSAQSLKTALLARPGFAVTSLPAIRQCQTPDRGRGAGACQVPRGPEMALLGFLRWVAERRRLEHQAFG